MDNGRRARAHRERVRGSAARMFGGGRGEEGGVRDVCRTLGDALRRGDKP